MTTTLEEIHRDPAILDRAISLHEPLDIVAHGEITATLLPTVLPSLSEADRAMSERCAAPTGPSPWGNP